MRLDNVLLYDLTKYHSFEVDESSGTIINILSSDRPMPTTKNGIDLEGCFITPGFIDTHIHGFFNVDTCDGDPDTIVLMAKELAKAGISSFCPTTMTVSKDKMFAAIDASYKAKEILDSLKDTDERFASIIGLHLEGPFLNPTKCGVQNVEDSVLPSKASEIIEEIEEKYPGFLKIIDIAPELTGGNELIAKYSDKYVFSIAHSEATYEESKSAFDSGAKSVTHVLNAMNPMLKRTPGILGAAIDSNVFIEVIADGYHIHNSYLKLLYSDVLENRIITVSDSMRGANMPNGIYDLGGVSVEVRDGRTYFGPNGDLAGSVTNLTKEFENLASAGIDLNRITNSMTVNPMNRILGTEYKSYMDLIDIDCPATFNLFNKDAKMIGVINRGKVLWIDEA